MELHLNAFKHMEFFFESNGIAAHDHGPSSVHTQAVRSAPRAAPAAVSPCAQRA